MTKLIFASNLFEEQALIFVPVTNNWHPPSACIWADDEVQMPGKVSIKTPYNNLDDFFCKNLSVPRPDLQMHIQALQDLSHTRPPPTTSQLQNMIKLVSSMGPSPEDVIQLRNANIFSVLTTNGERRVTSIASEWAIVDRLEYGSAFSGQLNMLDYTLKEVRSCSNFLLALDLRRRHLSELVEEKTTVREGFFDSDLTRMFRTKAYALFRQV